MTVEPPVGIIEVIDDKQLKDAVLIEKAEAEATQNPKLQNLNCIYVHIKTVFNMFKLVSVVKLIN